MKTDLDTRFTVRNPQVIHRVIDDEVVMIDLESGNYYTLLGTATTMWGCIDAGMSIGETLGHLRQRYEGDPQEMERGLRRLVDQLQEETLIVQATGAVLKDGPPEASEGRGVFTDPVFERYDDMADLILLDPVHEIDQEEGWPRKPTQ